MIFFINCVLILGNWTPFKHLSLRILLATVCLSAFVIVNAYSCILISYLTASKLPATKTFEELAARSPQDLTLITDKNTPYSELILVIPLKKVVL